MPPDLQVVLVDCSRFFSNFNLMKLKKFLILTDETFYDLAILAVPKVDDEERQPSEKVVGLVDAIAGLTLQVSCHFFYILSQSFSKRKLRISTQHLKNGSTSPKFHMLLLLLPLQSPQLLLQKRKLLTSRKKKRKRSKPNSRSR